MSNPVVTYQGRLVVTDEEAAFLDGCVRKYNLVERKLYADMRRTGERAASFKNGYLLHFGITARQFNAVARNLEGKIASVAKLLPLRRQELQTRIAKANRVLGKIKNPSKLHQKKRRLHLLETKLAALDEQIALGDPRICFGSRKLFRAQFDLDAAGYANHEEWRRDWQAARASQFYVLGSKDETAGCQGCVLTAYSDGTFHLRLRSLSKEASYLELHGVPIPYGRETLEAALANRQALSYRFVRDDKGWRVFVTTECEDVPRVSVRDAGGIGVDINADCLALSETDRYGNLVGTEVIPLVTYGKNTAQAKALIGDAVKIVCGRALDARKPLVVEKLDFVKKRAGLEGEEARRARMLSSFAYHAILQHLKARAYRLGVEVIEVSPAYTSTMGAVRYAAEKGISVHQAAALAIARRGSGFREQTTRGEALVPTPKGDHVTFPLPARTRRKHVWSFWSSVRNIHKAVLEAHTRPPLRGDPSRPRPAKRTCPVFTVRPRDANRPQHCSADVVDSLPW